MAKKRYMTILGGYTLDMADQGRLVRQTVDTTTPGDYGADPMGDGKFKMVPSGDVVDLEERNRRLEKRR